MAEPTGARPNYLYSIVSVTLVLLLLGLFGLMVLQGRQLVNELKEQVEIIVELKEDKTREDIEELKAFLEKSIYYKEESWKYIGKEEGAKMMQEEFGDAFLKLDMANPLYDVVTFHMWADYVEVQNMKEVKERIKGFGYVNDVYYQETVADAIARNLKKVSIGVLIAGLFFIVVAVALILNTIRLALYANRFLIKNMELVGASWSFISRPFLVRSLWHGLLAGILSTGLLSLVIYLIGTDAPGFTEILSVPGLVLLFGALLALGIGITVLSTYYVVNKYLRMRVDDLY